MQEIYECCSHNLRVLSSSPGVGKILMLNFYIPHLTSVVLKVGIMKKIKNNVRYTNEGSIATYS